MVLEKVYGLYDTKDKNQCVGIFKKAKNIAKYTGNTIGSIYSAISKGNKVKARYEIVKIRVDQEESHDLRNGSS